MNKIRELREEKSIRAEDLANRLGITVRYLYDLEKGNRRLNEDLINGLCDFLGVEAEYLLGRTDDPSPRKKPSETLTPEALKKHGLTGIDLYEEANKNGLTDEEAAEILRDFGPLYKKHQSKFVGKN